MPIYEYSCQHCGKIFDYFARTLSDKPQVCPHCDSPADQLTKNLTSFRASTTTDSCPHADHCAHSHSAGCGCGCCG